MKQTPQISDPLRVQHGQGFVVTEEALEAAASAVETIVGDGGKLALPNPLAKADTGNTNVAEELTASVSTHDKTARRAIAEMSQMAQALRTMARDYTLAEGEASGYLTQPRVDNKVQPGRASDGPRPISDGSVSSPTARGDGRDLGPHVSAEHAESGQGASSSTAPPTPGSAASPTASSTPTYQPAMPGRSPAHEPDRLNPVGNGARDVPRR